MAIDLEPAPIDPATAGSDYWARHHEFRRVRQRESRPDDPVRPDEVEEVWLKRNNPFRIEHRFEIARDSRTLSTLSVEVVKPGTPEYDTNKHLLWADLYVRPDERRHRIGTRWLPVLLDLMEQHGSTIADMWAEELAGHAFLKWLGAEERFSGAENRLRLGDVDWAMVERWAAEGPGRSPSTRVEVYDGPMPESMWDDFAPQLSFLLNTIPQEDLDHGEIIITTEGIRDFTERLAEAGETMHSMIAREPDGVISGITDTRWAPYRPTIVYQGFTGVRPEHRGRGIGKWLKAAMLLHMREVHPEAQWVSTDNAGSNAPMLAINKQLGFRQYRAGSEYQIGRERLAQKLESIGR